MSNDGYFLVHRKIQDCWIWTSDEPFDRRSAWIDIIMMANHKDTKILFDGELVTVKRGQRITSIRALAARWKWGKAKVSEFLKVLEEDGMITKESDSRRTLLTVINYGFYQLSSDSERTVTGRSQGQCTDGHRPQTINDNNDKEREEEEVTRARAKTPVELEAPVEMIPLNDGSGWRPTMSEYEEYERLFPNVDVDSEFRKMRAWCLSNTLKTRRGIKRFVNGWLSRAQDKPKPKTAHSSGSFDANDWLLSQIRGGDDGTTGNIATDLYHQGDIPAGF